MNFRWLNLRRWFKEHSLKILAIRDTPRAIAGGVAIGVFFGFLPTPGIKTISTIFVAWLTGSNILAAVLASALHDIFIPVMPAIYLWEYKVGYWLLSSPHQWPPALHDMEWEGPVWHLWRKVLSMGKPLLAGGFVCSVPAGAITFWITQAIVSRHQVKRRAREATPVEGADNPS